MTPQSPDPLPLSAEALIDQITELAAHIHAATYRLLVLIRELDRRGVWADHGCNSCAHWLNWQCGIGLNAGREKVRVAHALETLPRISEAFRSGRISYSKVRAMTRAATPENEAELMNVAWYGTAAHVEKLTRYYRRAKEAEALEAANDRHEKRGLEWYYGDDGMLEIRCRLDPEDGARFVKALKGTATALEDDAPEDVSAETSGAGLSRGLAVAARRADALVKMAETAIARGIASPPPGERFEVTVHIDAGTLTGESPGGMSETDDARPLCPEIVRRLGCDSALVGLIEDGEGEPLNIGRRTRAIPPAL
ncbi:MAG: 13E12 repeat family protein [Gammaproteobacteria bacterium]|nr:13E12 repeat family protein [Gammaproteobacteria bacterium]